MKTWFGILVLIAVVVLIATVPASAQTYNGRFTLTSEVTWGKAVLPAGDYSYRLSRITDVVPLMVTVYGINGNELTAYITPMTFENRDFSANNNLIIFRNGNERTVRALELGGIGFIMYYPVPANVQHMEIASAERIPLGASSGK